MYSTLPFMYFHDNSIIITLFLDRSIWACESETSPTTYWDVAQMFACWVVTHLKLNSSSLKIYLPNRKGTILQGRAVQLRGGYLTHRAHRSLTTIAFGSTIPLAPRRSFWKPWNLAIWRPAENHENKNWLIGWYKLMYLVWCGFKSFKMESSNLR